MASGKVAYLRRVNIGNYEHKEFQAEISYGEDATVDAAAREAVRVVHQYLGLAEGKPADEPVTHFVPPPPAWSSGSATVKMEAPPPANEPVKIDGRSKAARAARAPVPREEAGPVVPLRNDPLLGGGAAPSQHSAPSAPAAPVVDPVADPLLAPLPAAPALADLDDMMKAPADVTDGELVVRIMAKAKALGDGVKKIIAHMQTHYAATPSAIKLEDRAKFLAEIEAL